MPRLRNPVSGTEDDFTEGQARVRRRKGWLDVDPPADDTYDVVESGPELFHTTSADPDHEPTD